MGHSRKDEIAKLKRDRKQAKAAKKRPENVRYEHVRFLIVCEGTKTEPNYFEALVKDYGSVVREEIIKGEGRATVALVNRTQEIKTNLELKNHMRFDRVWVVFDKDDFLDFNEAVVLCKRLGFNSAWTNEAFELWYYLHFEYLDNAIGRDDYIHKLQEFMSDRMGDNSFKYKKKDPQIYSHLKQYGNEELAKRHARKLRKLFTGTDYASHKPCTRIDLLVEELEHPENLLNSVKS